MANIVAGKITHFYHKIMVAVIVATDEKIAVGDKIWIGDETDGFEQVVDSLQVDHAPITELAKGEEAGMKVTGVVHEGDVVYLVR